MSKDEINVTLFDEVVSLRAANEALAKQFVDMKAFADAQEIEAKRLLALINNPHTNDFLEAVRMEAAHQRERWAAEHDAGKADADWFWLLGYLGGKALFSANFVTMHGGDTGALGEVASQQREKALHHIITTAAACLNWHAARAGASSVMRPGIAPPP